MIRLAPLLRLGSLVLLAGACQQTPADPGASRPAGADSGSAHPGGTDSGDGGAEGAGGRGGGPGIAPATTVTESTVGDHAADDAWLFSLDTLHEVEITLPEASVAGLIADPYGYVEGEVRFDGVLMPRVGVRLRGKIGSFRPITGKPKFKLDFNQYIEDQRFFGHETLSLNNSVVDCSYIKEAVAYRVIEAAGVPAPRAGYATVTVNGEPYGLYVLVEVPDDRFLARHWEDPSGNLYDGKYIWYGGGSYTLLDFAIGVDTGFQLEEGAEVGHADISAVSAALYASAGKPDFYATMGEVIDWPSFHREQVAEQWVGQNDGYGLNRNNYRVYFDPADGKARVVPWDFDYSFLYDYQWGRSWAAPTGHIAYWCMVDPTCKAAQRLVAGELLAAIDAIRPDEIAAQAANLIQDAALSDPRRECAAASIGPSQAHVFAWTANQSANLRAWWSVK